MASVIREQRFEKAAELLAFLDPLDGRWCTGPGQWVYRGQGQDSWKLVPTVLRKKPGEPAVWERSELSDVRTEGGELDVQSRRRWGEVWLVFEFRELADQVGLPIPEDSARLRSMATVCLR
jgi:hypothetical protein